MKKITKLIKSIFFISIWLKLFSFLSYFALDTWKDFHLKFIYSKVVKIFLFDFWFQLKDILFGFDLSFYLEEIFRYLTLELPVELLKFMPIYYILKFIYKKK